MHFHTLHRLRGRLAALACAVFYAAVPATAGAAGFPEHALNLVIPYPPGGPNDTIGRALAAALAPALGQTVVVENRAGASGNIAASHVARAAADGYTLLLPGSAIATAPSLFQSVPYRIEDFRAVSMVATGPLIVVAHPALGARTLGELIGKAKAQPGRIAYGSSGMGSTLHLGAEMFKTMAGVDLLHVPYKGTGPVITDLLSGRTPVAFLSALSVAQHIQEGKLIALATSGKTRMRGWENLPTVAEALPGYEVVTWFPVLAPAGTPDDVVDKLNQAVRTAQASKIVQDQLVSLGLDVAESSPRETDDYIKAEAAKWARWVEENHIERIQ